MAKLRWQDMIYHFDDGNLDSPHVRKGNSHFQSNESSADNYGMADLACCALLLNSLGCFEAGDGGDVLQVCPGDRGNTRTAASGNDKLVISEGTFFSSLRILSFYGLCLAVNGQCTHMAYDIDVLLVLEKGFISHHAGVGGAKTVHLRNVAADEIRDAASPVGNVRALVDHGNVAVWEKALGACCSF